LARVDAVLFTHSHADHILGLDELRRFNAIQGGAIPCYANVATWETLRQTFSYIFDGVTRLGGGIPELDPHEIAGPFAVGGGAHCASCRLARTHAGVGVSLRECGVPDRLQSTRRQRLGVGRWCGHAHHRRAPRSPHGTHFSLNEALDVIARIKPRRAFTTHMTHDLGHAATSARLPAGVELAYDGLVLDVSVDVE
jgi:phosphoribosyl 1,2-cyclic phosphate phosphodiesterase